MFFAAPAFYPRAVNGEWQTKRSCTRKNQPLVHLSHVQMCTRRFTVLPDCNKEHWRFMLCMRLSSQTQSQHQTQDAVYGCCNPTDHSTSPGPALTLSPNSPNSALVAGFVPALPNKGNTVFTGSHSRTREHFLNLSVIAEGRNFDDVWHPPVPTDNSWQQITFGMSRKGTPLQHDWFHNVVLSRYWSIAVVADFDCVFRCIGPQTHKCVCLIQETWNTALSSTNTFFDTVCVWIVSASCGVKDSMFSQPVVDCAHKLSSFIAVETPNSAQQQLHIHHRISDCVAPLVCQRLRLFVNALTKPNRVSLRSASDTPTSGRPLAIFPCSRRLSLVLSATLDVHAVHSGSNSRCPPRKCSMSTLSLRQ